MARAPVPQQKKTFPSEKNKTQPPEGKFKSSCGCALVSHPITVPSSAVMTVGFGIGNGRLWVPQASSIKLQKSDKVHPVPSKRCLSFEGKNMETFQNQRIFESREMCLVAKSYLEDPWNPSVAEVGDLESVRVTLGVTCWLVWGKSRERFWCTRRKESSWIVEDYWRKESAKNQLFII